MEIPSEAARAVAWATLASVHPQTGASELNNTGNMASASLGIWFSGLATP